MASAPNIENAILALRRAKDALTYEQIEQLDASLGVVACDDAVPLLRRSIGQDLTMLDRQMGGKGRTLLGAIGQSVDEALIAVEEALRALEVLL